MRTISIRAYAWAVHCVIWFVVIATVLAERLPPFKQLLASGFGHHWVAKSDIAIILFIVVAIISGRKKDPDDITGLIRGVLLSAVLGALAIFVFYLLHYMGVV